MDSAVAVWMGESVYGLTAMIILMAASSCIQGEQFAAESAFALLQFE